MCVGIAFAYEDTDKRETAVLIETNVLAAPARTGWLARLDLEYAVAHARTGLTRRSHSGPLVVQKPLYPEGPEVCHTLILHPPGGIVGRRYPRGRRQSE